MKVIIAGSRTINNYSLVEQAVEESGLEITEVVSGMASGIDMLGVMWATNNNVDYAEFPADWKKYGKSAGFIRNREMADYADALICVWDGVSRGSKNMISIATSLDMPVYIKQIHPERDDINNLEQKGFKF